MGCSLMRRSLGRLLRRLAVLMGIFAAVLALAACASYKPEQLVPERAVLASAGQRFDGSVSVGVVMNVPTLRLQRPKQIVTAAYLAARIGLPYDAFLKATALDKVDFPRPQAQYFSEAFLGLLYGRWQLTVDPRVFGHAPRATEVSVFADIAADWGRTYTPLIRDAVKQSLADSRLFPRVVDAGGDYVLDLWLDWYDPHAPPRMGMGTWKADVAAMWRLVRARDGKVLACDYVEGQGAFRKFRFSPDRWAFQAAVQDMIGEVLGLLSTLQEDSLQRLEALVPGGLVRAGAGGAVPEGAAEWSERVRRNWPQLHAGMSYDEVVAVLGPISPANESWNCALTLPFVTGEFAGGGEGVGVAEFLDLSTDLYTLVLMAQGVQKRSALNPPKSAPPNQALYELEVVAPMGLAIWKLKEK